MATPSSGTDELTFCRVIKDSMSPAGPSGSSGYRCCQLASPTKNAGITVEWTLRPYDDTLMSDHLASSLGNHPEARQNRATASSLITGRSDDFMSTPQILR